MFVLFKESMVYRIEEWIQTCIRWYVLFLSLCGGSLYGVFQIGSFIILAHDAPIEKLLYMLHLCSLCLVLCIWIPQWLTMCKDIILYIQFLCSKKIEYTIFCYLCNQTFLSKRWKKQFVVYNNGR